MNTTVKIECKLNTCHRPALVYGTCDRHTPLGKPRHEDDPRLIRVGQ